MQPQKIIEMRYCLLFLLLLFIPSLLPAKGKDTAKTKPALKLITDTGAVTEKKLDTRAFLKDPDFVYHTDVIEGESTWTRFWNWFWRKLFGKATDSPGAGKYVEYFFIALSVLFLIFIVMRINGINGSQIFRGKSKNADIPFTESLEDIYQVDFENELEKSLSAHNYRLAVRLLYLLSLRQLNDAGLINWQIEKTNSVYVNELPQGEKKRLFGLLTRQFEYTWYGDFFIDVKSFQDIRSLFQQFKESL